MFCSVFTVISNATAIADLSASNRSAAISATPFSGAKRFSDEGLAMLIFPQLYRSWKLRLRGPTEVVKLRLSYTPYLSARMERPIILMLTLRMVFGAGLRLPVGMQSG